MITEKPWKTATSWANQGTVPEEPAIQASPRKVIIDTDTGAYDHINNVDLVNDVDKSICISSP